MGSRSPTRFLRFSPTRGPNEGLTTSMLHLEKSLFSPVLPVTHFARSQLGSSCQHMCQRFSRRFRVRSPCCTAARFNTRHGPRPTCHFLRASPSPTKGHAPKSSSVAVLFSTTVTLDKAASETLPPALLAHHDSAEHPTDSGPQEPSAVSHSVSRVARTSRDQAPVVPAAPPLLSLSSQTALPSLPPSGLISS